MTVPPHKIDQLRRVLKYDPTTGNITWLVSASSRAPVGSIAGTNATKYRQVNFDGKIYRSHVLAFALHIGTWPDGVIDHVNGDGFDNRWVNLRVCTRSMNQGNRKRSAHSLSPYKGAHYDGRYGKWTARITVAGKRTHLGRFDTAEEAAEAYHVAAVARWGEFAVTWRSERGRA